MKRVFVLFLSWCVLFQSIAIVAAPAASAEEKEQIVLLPIRGQGLTENEMSLYRDAVAQGLSTNYTVKYGDQVDKVVQDIFAEESKSGLECDESRCYRDIATMLNVKLIAKATIIPRASDYQISMVIYNVYENKSVMTKVSFCKKCEPDQLVEKLVVLASAGKNDISGVPLADERSAAAERIAAAERERLAVEEGTAAAERERIATEEGKTEMGRTAARERKSADDRKLAAERERVAAAERERTAAAERTAVAEGGPKEKGGVRWYWYLLGIAVAGGAAAALGGGGGGGSSATTTTTTNPGTVNVSW